MPIRLETGPEKQKYIHTSLGESSAVYRDLKLEDPSTTIRLLELLPGRVGEISIETRLFNVELSSVESTYEALSYAWGTATDPKDLKFIHVNQIALSVTPNLHSALHALRNSDRPRIIWVDSICINQADLAERTQQVMLMAKIYAQAKRTVVYLGPSTRSSTEFFKFLTQPIFDRAECKDCGGDHGNKTWSQLPKTVCTNAGLDEEAVLDGFIYVSTCRWWDRVWILQEYTLSRDDPMIYCGRDQVLNARLAKNFKKLYDWVMHRKLHPEPIDLCPHFACHEDKWLPFQNRQSQSQASVRLEDGTEGFENGAPDGQESDKTSPLANIKEDPAAIFRLESTELSQQKPMSQAWSTWGQLAWKPEAVLERRTLCSPWHPPDYLYRDLKASCSDPHDVVYGVRELMEPIFRDVFEPEYTMSIPKLYSKLAAYLITFHHWPDLFWYYPFRLSTVTPGVKSTDGMPSWAPDFTRPHQVGDAEKTPPKKSETISVIHTIPQILDRVLFMHGYLVDEIFDVYPLPKDDPFKALQQLWYVERLHGYPPYTLIDGTSWDGMYEDRGGFAGMLQKDVGGISRFPTIAWATRHSGLLPSDVSLVHIVAETVDFEMIPETFKQCFELIGPYLKEQFELEGKGTGPCASDSHIKEWNERHGDIIDRLSGLWGSLVGDKWVDFVGICTFDYENLRAQLGQGLVPLRQCKPVRMTENGDSKEQEGVKCDPPLSSAVLQRPIEYRSLQRAVAECTESEGETRMRRQAVLLLAQMVHNAAIKFVGGSKQVTYVRVGEAEPDYDRSYDDAGSNPGPDAIIEDFEMMPIPHELQDESQKDRPFSGFWRRNEKPHVDRQDRGAQDNVADSEWRSLLQGKLKRFASMPELKNLHHFRLLTETKNIQPRDVHDGRTNTCTEPYGKSSRWRRIRPRPSPQTHFLLADLVDFISGRELFFTQSGLLGLTGPATTGVLDGDDVLVIQGMSFPLIARLEPLEELGNPKKRRIDIPTLAMRREIVGTAVLKDIDTKAGELEEIVFPDGFVPVSGDEPGRFRFK